jgi:hypothetical protein
MQTGGEGTKNMLMNMHGIEKKSFKRHLSMPLYLGIG